jgi:predicted Zn-dependent protease
MQKAHFLTFFLISFFAIMLLDGCAVNPVTGKKQVVFMTEAQEIAMGREYDPQITAFFGLYEDEKLQAFIEEKGKEMAAISHRPNLPYSFKIVDSPVINAFAVPGGFVYFTRGIMAHFSSEAEFAGVLGHEIGHITARHSVIQQRNQILGQVGLIAGVIIKPELVQFVEPLSSGLGLIFLKFGRDAERQSDELGVEYATRIGYDAMPMADFFDVLERKSGGSEGQVPTFLSTHPSPAERSVTVKSLATKWKEKLGKENYLINRNEYLRRIEGIVYGENPRQGFVESGVFYHPDMAFQYNVPNNWRVENSPSQVQMSPQDGKAVMIFRLAQGTDVAASSAQMLEQYNLELIEGSNTTLNGLSARLSRAVQKQEGGELSVLMMHILYKNQIYAFIGAADSKDFSAYANTIRNSMESFKALTDAEKLNRQAERVALHQVQQDGLSLSEVLAAQGVPPGRLEELALLNGMLLTDKIDRGTLIKLVK